MLTYWIYQVDVIWRTAMNFAMFMDQYFLESTAAEWQEGWPFSLWENWQQLGGAQSLEAMKTCCIYATHRTSTGCLHVVRPGKEANRVLIVSGLQQYHSNSSCETGGPRRSKCRLSVLGYRNVKRRDMVSFLSKRCSSRAHKWFCAARKITVSAFCKVESRCSIDDDPLYTALWAEVGR